MWLTELEADRLRNLRAVQLKLPAGLTVVSGRNGQGKTGLLEAVYLLGTGRSFRTRRQDEILSWDGGPLRVEGRVTGRTGKSKLTVLIDAESRQLLADGGRQELESFIGRLSVVDLTAERMRVLRGGPEERRRFLDRGVVGLQPSFLRSLGEYRRVLQQRNALLRGGGPERGAELQIWDEHLVRSATEVHRRRREYAVRLASHLGESGRALFPDGSEIRLRYRPSPAAAAEADVDAYPEILARTLARNRDRDRALGHTGSGPHRDEWGPAPLSTVLSRPSGLPR